jgi:hypothetical protein
MDVLEACLMETGRPVLIAPAKAPRTLSGTVAIAWKDRPEAAKAVAAALPFILKTAVGSDLRGGFVGVHNPCEQLTPAQGVAADRVGVPSGSV